MKKSYVLELIQELPEDITDDAADKLIYTLWFRRKLERALAEANAGCEVSLEEIDRVIDEWPG